MTKDNKNRGRLGKLPNLPQNFERNLLNIPFCNIEERADTREFHSAESRTDSPNVRVLPGTDPVDFIVEDLVDLRDRLLAFGRIQLGDLQLNQGIQFLVTDIETIGASGVRITGNLAAQPVVDIRIGESGRIRPFLNIQLTRVGGALVGKAAKEEIGIVIENLQFDAHSR